MAKLEGLPVDYDVPPGDEQTMIELIDQRISEALSSPAFWITLACLFLFLFFKRLLAQFDEVRVRKAEAKRRLNEISEASIEEEVARLRKARDAARGAESA